MAVHVPPCAHEGLFVGQAALLLHARGRGAPLVAVMQAAEARPAVAVEGAVETVLPQEGEEAIHLAEFDDRLAVPPAGEAPTRPAGDRVHPVLAQHHEGFLQHRPAAVLAQRARRHEAEEPHQVLRVAAQRDRADGHAQRHAQAHLSPVVPDCEGAAVLPGRRVLWHADRDHDAACQVPGQVHRRLLPERVGADAVGDVAEAAAGVVPHDLDRRGQFARPGERRQFQGALPQVLHGPHRHAERLVLAPHGQAGQREVIRRGRFDVGDGVRRDVVLDAHLPRDQSQCLPRRGWPVVRLRRVEADGLAAELSGHGVQLPLQPCRGAGVIRRVQGESRHLAAPGAVRLEAQGQALIAGGGLEHRGPREFVGHVRVPDVHADRLDVLEPEQRMGGAVGPCLTPGLGAVDENAPLPVHGLLAAPVAAVLVVGRHAVAPRRGVHAEVVSAGLAEVLQEHGAEGGVSGGACPRRAADRPPAVAALGGVDGLVRDGRPAGHQGLAGRAEVEGPYTLGAACGDEAHIVQDDAPGRAPAAEAQVEPDDAVGVNVALDVVVAAPRLSPEQAPHGDDPLVAARREDGLRVVAVPVATPRVGPRLVGNEHVRRHRLRVGVVHVHHQGVVGRPVAGHAVPVQVGPVVLARRVEDDFQGPLAARDALGHEARRAAAELPLRERIGSFEVAQHDFVLRLRERTQRRQRKAQHGMEH